MSLGKDLPRCNVALRKLRQFALLGAEEADALERALLDNVRRLGPREDVIREGEPADYVNVLLTGWACSYKTLEDGRRQILSFILPGDLFDVNCYLLDEMDHSVGSLTEISYAAMPPPRYEQLVRDHAGLARAVLIDSMIALSTQREWTLNVGRRDAYERTAHLMCELFVRLGAVGLSEHESCPFPLTQGDLAEATGLSTVHVNRTIQALRAARLIVLTSRSLTIPDLDALQLAAMFNPNYMHGGVRRVRPG